MRTQRRTSAGDAVRVWSSLTPIRDANGAVIGIAEALRREASAAPPSREPGPVGGGPGHAPTEDSVRLKLALEASRMGVWEWRMTDDRLFWSPECLELLGRSEFGGHLQDFLDQVHPEDAGPLMLAAREAADLGQTFRREFRIFRGDGTLRWVENVAHTDRDADGRPLRMLGTIRDVTDQRLTAAHLDAEQERLRAIASVSPAVPYSFHISADGATSLPYFGAALADLFGIDQEDVRLGGAAVFRHIAPEDIEPVRASIQESARTLAPWHFEWRHLHPARGESWIEAFSSPVRDADGGTTWHGVVQDVTERRRAATTLRRWGDAFEHCAHGIAMGIPANNRFLACNPAYARLLGFAVAEMEGRAILDCYVPEDRDRVLQLIQRADREGHVQYEARMQHRDGRPIPVQVDIVSVRDSAARPVYRIATVQDITRRQDALSQLHALSDWLQAILGSSPVPIVAMDRGGTVLLWNPAAERLFGWTSDETMGHANPVVPLGGADVAEAARRRVREAESFDGLVQESLTRDGRRLTLGVSAAPLRDRGGRVMGSVHTFLDLTPHVRAQQALRESEARFRELADNIREVFWLTDVPKGRIEYVSPAYATIWGRSCESLERSPMDWVEALHADDRERIREAAATKQAAGTYDEEYRIVRPDGTVRWIRDRAFPVRDADGRVIRVAGVAEDVTERRELEARLRQHLKMESVGQLAGGVAHDFNNFLTVISGCAELLEMAAPDSDRSRELLGEIRAATDRAGSLTRQLLAFSRQDIVEPRAIDLNAIVRETERLLRRVLREDVSLVTALDDSIASIRGDAGQWAHVLLNLAVNARDAMPDGGSLAIATRAATTAELASLASDTPPGARYVCLSVADTGEGMSPEIRQRIFEPYFTTKGLGHGTGLGLSVVHGVVTQGGGFIDVRTAPDEGTTIRIFMPAIDAAPMKEPVRTRSATRPRHETILVVEDEEGIRRVASRVLETQGYRILLAEDGVAALELLDRWDGPLDLLLTDVVMPRMDGRQLAEQVRQRFPNLRVIYTSGYTDDAVLRRGVRESEVAFLPKPYVPETLRTRIAEVLDRA